MVSQHHRHAPSGSKKFQWKGTADACAKRPAFSVCSVRVSSVVMLISVWVSTCYCKSKTAANCSKYL